MATRSKNLERWLAVTVAVFAVALVAQTVVVWQYRADPMSDRHIADAQSYHEWATRIAAVGLTAEPVFHQSPLFPILLSGVYRMTDDESRRTAAVMTTGLLNAGAIALLVPVGFFYLGSVRRGALAAALALLYGPIVFYGLKLLPVSLALFTQSAALVAWAIACRRPHPWTFGIAGAAWGFATLARAEVMLFVPIAVLGLWLVHKDRSDSQLRRGGATAALVLSWAVIVLPVTLHNVRSGDLVLVASSSGENLFIGNQRSATGGYEELAPGAGNIFSQRVAARAEAEHDLGKDLLPSEVSAYWRSRAIAEITADPGGWIVLEARKLARILDPGDPTDIYSFILERRRYLTALYALPLGAWAVIGLGVIGIGIAVRNRHRRSWPLAAIVGLHLFVLLVFFVDSRLRIPLLYFLTPFGALAVDKGLHRWKENRGRPRIVAVALFVVATTTAFLFAEPTPRDRTRLASVLSLQQRMDDALDVLEPELSRENPDAYVVDHAGWMHQKRNEFAAARDRYLQALASGQLVPSRARQTRTRLGQVLEQLGDPAAARAQHDAAIASGHANAGTFYERGRFLLRHGDIEGAVTDFRESIRLDPDWPPPREALQAIARRLGSGS